MKNFQKIAFGVLVGLMAIGFSAFTNSGTNSSAFVTGTYYHVGNQYLLLSSPPSGRTCKADDNSCTIQYTADPLPTSFSEDAIPADAVQGEDQGSWQQ